MLDCFIRYMFAVDRSVLLRPIKIINNQDVWPFAYSLPLKRQEKKASENVVCWSPLLQIIA